MHVHAYHYKFLEVQCVTDISGEVLHLYTNSNI